MRVCVFWVLVVWLQLGVLVGYTVTDDCPIRLSPDSLLVEYGQKVEVNCSLTTPRTGPFTLGWEATVNPVDGIQKTSVVWSVPSLTEWDMNKTPPLCKLGSNCRKRLQLNVYKRPDSVMIYPEAGNWSEGQKRKLICEIRSVGPVDALTVQWTRVDQNRTRTVVKSRNFTVSRSVDKEDEVGNVTHTLDVWTSPEDDGVQYQCAALLNLTLLERPQVGISQTFNVTVLYKPVITQPSAATVHKTVGDTLMLNCVAHGNPDPQYNWTAGHSTNTHSSLLSISNIQSEHRGNYTCIASNSEGSASVTVTVTVSEDNLPIIASCAAVAVALLIVGLFVWYCMHYRQTHMGHYILKNLTSRRHNGDVAHFDTDQREL